MIETELEYVVNGQSEDQVMRRINGESVHISGIASATGMAVFLVLGTASVFAAEIGEQVAADSGEQELVVEEVVVTGVRQNLERALEIKKSATTIVDAISYEDIGSFPALDLGEALQAIPGVQINREGERRLSEINLRGLPGGFVKVLANGQGFATPARSNGAPKAEQNPFGSFDAQVFDGVVVIKSPSADIPEGGIAGVIDKQLARALRKKDGFQAKLEYRYEDLNDSWNPGLMLAGTKHIIQDELAVTFKLATTEQSFRRDTLSNPRYQTLTGGRFAGLAEWKNDHGLAESDVVQYSSDVHQLTEYNEGWRTSFVGGLEWQPHDELKLGMDILYTRRDMDESTFEQNSVQTRFNGVQVTPIGDPFYAGVDNSGNDVWVVNEYAFENARYRSDHRSFKFTEEARGVFFNADWVHDKWRVVGNLSASDSFNEFQQDLFGARYDFRSGSGGISGALNTGAGNPRDYYRYYTGWEGVNWDQPFFLSSTPADDISVASGDKRNNIFIGGGANNRDRKNVNYDVNAEYAFDFKVLSSIKLGIRGTTEDLRVESFSNSANGVQLENISNSLFRAPIYTRSTNFFGGNAPGFTPYEGGWLSFDPAEITAALQPVDCGDAPSNPITGFCARTFRDQVTNRSIGDNFDASLDTSAAYLMANFDATTGAGRSIWGNLGVRYVKTDFTGNGNSLINGTWVPETATNDYTNLLPSLNFNMELREDLIMRFGYSETIVRPALVSFKPSSTVTESDTRVRIDLPGSDLEAYTADSFDLSLEWYNRKGSAVSVAFYQKEIASSFLKEGVCPEDGGDLGYGPLELIDQGGGDVLCYITTPYYNESTDETYLREMDATQYVNSDEIVTLTGYEIAIQQNLDFLPAPWNGFGGIINYSHVEGETEDGEDALLGDQFSGGVSPVSYNVIAYWQNEKVNLRLSYNYRDRYKLDGIGSFTGFEDRFVKARGQLDMLATYRMKKWLFGFRVYNITEELYEEYKGISKMKVGRTNWDGRTYSLSAAYTF